MFNQGKLVGQQIAAQPHDMQTVNNKNYQNKIKKKRMFRAEKGGREGGEE